MALEVTPLFVSCAEAALALGCSPKTVRGMVDRGELRGERRGKHYVVATFEIESRQRAKEGAKTELVRQAQILAAELAKVLAELRD